MSYKYNEESALDLKSYFEKFKEKLPQLTVITGGVYGKTKFDDFASDQIIRFHRYITQKRVLAKHCTVAGNDQFLTIPLNTDLKFRVIKGRNNLGPIESLSTILKNNKLPIFLNVESSLPSIVEKTPSGLNNQLLVTEEYTEYYLQGHCLAEGCINPTDISTAIVIPDISVANIEGFTDQPIEKFQEHLKNLDDQIKKHAQFNDKDVDTDIRLIEEKKPAKKSEPKADSSSGDEYDYIEPPMPKPRKQQSLDHSKESGNVGRPLPNVPSSKAKQPVTIPSLPPRGPLPSPPVQQPFSEKKSGKPYENENVHVVNPVVKQPEEEEDLYEPGLYGDVEDLPSPTPEKTNTPDHDNKNPIDSSTSDDHIRAKNVKEILDILKILKLDKYTEMFETDIVDGMTLKNFTEDDLKKEYNMRHAEAVRLMNFVRHGHIPK